MDESDGAGAADGEVREGITIDKTEFQTAIEKKLKILEERLSSMEGHNDCFSYTISDAPEYMDFLDAIAGYKVYFDRKNYDGADSMSDKIIYPCYYSNDTRCIMMWMRVMEESLKELA